VMQALDRAGYAILPLVTTRVRVTVRLADGGTESLSVSADEWATTLDGKFPDSENLERIRRFIQERNHYPLPEPQVPGPGKSYQAQGQTKKPGSHSHDRHK